MRNGSKSDIGFKLILITVLVLLPVLLFANVWQGYRFVQLSRDVARLETQQRRAIEENKRLIATIAVLRSPERIREVAEEYLEAEPLEPGQSIRIQIVSDAE
ncbi:MAG: cell division protein FtsL [Spirochaetota bacterium]